MAERREPGLNLNQLDDPVPTLEASSGVPNQMRAVAQKPPTKGVGFLAFIVVVLSFACAGLGYWGMELKRDLDEQKVLLEQMNLWLESTDATLTQANNSASQSGETLLGRLEQLDSRFDERVTHFDSEIAKLWTVSFQRNKPQLEAQSETLAEQSELLESQSVVLAEQGASLDVLRDEISNQVETLSELDVGMETLLSQLSQLDEKTSANEANYSALQSSLEELDGSFARLASDIEFQLSVERDERAKLQAELNSRVNSLNQSGSQTSALVGRVSELESLIAGIDASRQSLTAKLVELQAQISNIER